jgi:PAS domain-containing protein
MKEEPDRFSNANFTPSPLEGIIFPGVTKPVSTEEQSGNSFSDTNLKDMEERNQKLQESNSIIEKALVDYINLFDNAPTGYLTLDQNGDIFKINFYAAEVLG